MGPTPPLPQWPMFPLSMPYAEEAQRARATSADARPRRFIPVAEVLRERQSSLNPPAGQSGMSAAPGFLSQLMPSRAAWQAALDTAPFPAAGNWRAVTLPTPVSGSHSLWHRITKAYTAALSSGPEDVARSLPAGGPGKMNLKKAVEALGARVLTRAEYTGSAKGLSGPYVPTAQRIVGPGGQRLEDPAYLYEYAKDWYRQAAMRAHPDKGGTEAAMQEVNAAWAFIEKHFGSQALRESLNPRLFQR